MIEITESLLVRLAGVRAFGQGLSSYDKGGVKNLETAEKLTKAIVHSEGSHKVVLRHSHSMIEGECDCEASDGIDFCQHCVAVAFALQDRSSTNSPVTKRQAMTAIRRHMAALSHEELLEQFMSILGEDHTLRDEQLQRVRLASGGLSFADLKKMIMNTAENGEPWDDKAVTAFFEEFENMLLCIREFADRLDSHVLVRALEFAVQRFRSEVECAGDYGDYSDYWDETAELLFDLHRDALSRLDWTPVEMESYLKDRCQSEGWHPAQWREDMQEVEEI
ncbi:MAG: hypothetical protein WBN61_13535 [Woeseiaceae bacterium]